MKSDEFPKLFTGLLSEKNVDFRNFSFLAIFTGARRADLLAMRWPEIDFHPMNPRWEIPDPKGGEPYVVPLIAEAVMVLQERRRRVKGDWVFPSAKAKSGHVRDFKSPWSKFLKRTKITNLRIHDLRRTLGSWQDIGNTSLHIIGKSLGHQPGSQATQVYAQLQTEPVRKAIYEATREMLSMGKVKKLKLLPAPRG